MSLVPFQGEWTNKEVAHLFRRTKYGFDLNSINEALQNGIESTVNNLFTVPDFNYPLSYLDDETIANLGESWVNSVYTSDPLKQHNEKQARRNSLAAWMVERLSASSSMFEKMCFFWHNHFGASTSFDSRVSFDYFRLIQTHAFGNFKQLVKEMTVNPNMLLFLNGSSNSGENPNENFSRELLELFTIGKGFQISEGDYTNYTEQDISEGARILSGWRLFNLFSTTQPDCYSNFVSNYHDSGTKVLSNRFGNAQFNNQGENEYKDYIDLIFAQSETPRYICRKLYRWFVSRDIDQNIESTIINEMSNLLVQNDYEIKPVLKALLGSQHFYENNFVGSLIKSPIEFIFSMLNSTNTFADSNFETRYRTNFELHRKLVSLGLDLLAPPSVAGWQAYYQVPSYDKLWVNSALIKSRILIAKSLTIEQGIDINGTIFKINSISFLLSLSSPSNAKKVVDDLNLIFCSQDFTDFKKNVMLQELLNGISETEWENSFNLFIFDQSNSSLKDFFEFRINKALYYLFKQPEFQIY